MQAFLKIPALKALAPQQTEPPFVVLAIVAVGGRFAAELGYHLTQVTAATAAFDHERCARLTS